MGKRTTGHFDYEAEAWAEFDARAEAMGCFDIYREVPGQYCDVRRNPKAETPCIDRVLSPRPDLIAAGWQAGHIGVECKRTREDTAKLIVQALDYSQAVFEMPDGCRVALGWVFLYPLDKLTGLAACIASAHSIGTVEPGFRDDTLLFRDGKAHLIGINFNGRLEVSCPKPRKRGHQ